MKLKNSGPKDEFYFEILVVDIEGLVVFKDEKSFCHNLLSNSLLWEAPEIKPDNYIYDANKNIRLHIKKIDSSKEETGSYLSQSYIITINGIFESVEAFRIPLLSYLKSLHFDSIYVLEDHISHAIAKSIYPGIYKVEAFLRKYVMKFFVLKLGTEWWKMTADSEMQKKLVKEKITRLFFLLTSTMRFI